MFAQSRSRHGRGRRRGVVLLLILAMLSIVALLGVTFATISGQAQVGAQYYAEVINNTNPTKIFDFAVEQLLNDTNNPKSAMRGHSLLRDMYGHDGQNNGYFPRLPDPLSEPMYVVQTAVVGGNIVITTNIPTWNNPLIEYAPDLFGRDFTGWTLRLQHWNLTANHYPVNRLVPPMAQTFVVIGDNYAGTYHQFTLSAADPDLANFAIPTAAPGGAGTYSVFELDARYRKAFNGTGQSLTTVNWTTSQVVPATSYIPPEWPNFLFNNPSANGYGYTDPTNTTTPSMDEDYDAPDTENWFMAIKSADGQVVIPSFFRPWTIVIDQPNNYSDWTATQATSPGVRSKFLRPRKIDHPASGDSFPDLIPDATTGKITYDVDNDGDGVTDSVWLDLGYPVQRDPSGKMFKPLFAIMCLPLNGRLPLNTAGNMDGRDPATGAKNFDHAVGRGYSANEVDPRYAFNAAPPATPIMPVNTMGMAIQYDNTGTLTGNTIDLGIGLGRLQTLLIGNNAVTPSPAGRYGEINAVDLTTNPIKLPGPGRSFLGGTAATGVYNSPWYDANFNTIDFYPTNFPEGLADGLQAGSEYLDPAGRNLLPSERFRWFVTPMDITGNGRLTRFDELPAPLVIATGAGSPFGTGFDDFGRVGFFHHFRPPGIVTSSFPAFVAGDNVNITETRLNLYHSYEAHRNPVGVNNNFMGRAAWNVTGTANNTTYTVDPNGNIQTYEPSLSTDIPVTASVTGASPAGNLSANLGYQEAAQLNLYRQEPYDEPFNNQDLEWLLRRGDKDGTSLSSRLESLFPDYLVNNPNQALYRNLFSVESWEPNASTWAVQPNGVDAYLTGSHIAHRDRRINLNFPLPVPVNGDPDEPTRQKWAREMYQLMKVVMYPPDGIRYRLDVNGFPEMYDAASNSWVAIPNLAEQLYEFGQYALNIVDFRDPDATMTHFVHPDLDVNPPAGAAPAGVQLAVGKAGGGTLDMYGMEHLPVAINEVLAFQYLRKDASNNKVPQKRLFIELANLLTQDANGTENLKAGTASDLDLDGWGVIITSDDPAAPAGANSVVERPNTLTGQLSTAAMANFLALADAGGVGHGPLDPPTQGLKNDTNPNDVLPEYATGSTSRGAGDEPRFYILCNQAPADGSGYVEDDEPTSVSTSTAQMDRLVTEQLPVLPASSGNAHWYWLHLLRPVNPLDPTSTKVVVDSIRFPYFEAGYDIVAGPSGDIPSAVNAIDVYSVGRLQPLKGGQIVPQVNNFSPKFSYGYSDQVPQAQGNDSRYDVELNGQALVQEIRDSIGRGNNPGEDPTDPDDMRWYHFPFLDRDFAGVAELLLVPNCAPGLFTKFFVERRGTDPGNLVVDPAYQPPDVWADLTPAEEAALRTQKAATYPYLPDGFFYTSVTPDPPLPAPPTWNKHKSVGWHKLLDFVEVPSPAFGAIGPAAEGDNGDWFRQDLRPGMINLNVIFDEEVFFGLISDPRLNTAPALVGRNSPEPNEDHPDTTQIGLPQIVTSLDLTGNPNGSYPISDRTVYANGRGFYDGADSFMKAAFADFLKLRHGGSNFIGLIRSAQTGFNLMSQTRNQFADRPFHSMSWPNLHDTLMRPARLENYQRAWNGGGTPNADQTQRPTVISTTPRLLFQVPDAYTPGAANESDTNTERGQPDGTPITDSTAVPPRLPDHIYLSNPLAGLANPHDLDGPAGVNQSLYLGAQGGDRREHPVFQQEWLQKILNLGTVRSHQYAVWVTVGFFEVVQEGNPQLALADPALVVDQLGREVGKDRGENVRHRSFFIIDRTKAVGFNPMNPDDFRKMVVYERRIE